MPPSSSADSSTAIVPSPNSTRCVKSDVIPAPYPWATTKRAHVRNLNDLLSSGIRTITGTVECDIYNHKQDLEFDLQREFKQVASFIAANKSSIMLRRTPEAWLYPPRTCWVCCRGESYVRPIISSKKRSINWLFLLLGEMIGHCTFDQLKYFCKHTNITPLTGGRDRLTCLAYLGLCKQLDPSGPFDP
ncbi:hypothetical protein HHK36_002459 [Tetracentron sinense]|uniref:DUF7086 domain-containing protein n=1 Tax=Tetracentron sinense TaxID=13715 RepID=A0A834ZM63_TETSI|nr:hypothetical protein HHK36_002459 [Tetracentron sinense]